jgi:inorganic pyrophosphatase
MAHDPQKLIVHVEIPRGSNLKLEIDEETKVLMVDRIMPTAFGFPENYGFIPDTKGKDGDPLDVYVLSSAPLLPNVGIKCKVIGMMEMEDEEGIDHKLIVVPLPKVDYECGQWNSLDDVPLIRRQRLQHFLENYKDLEAGKWVKLNGYKGYDEAVAMLAESEK